MKRESSFKFLEWVGGQGITYNASISVIHGLHNTFSDDIPGSVLPLDIITKTSQPE